MSDIGNDEEPSMEEILASIRKIISDDSDDEPVAETPVEDEVVPAADPEPEPIPEPEPEEDEFEVEFAEPEEEAPEPVYEPEPEPAVEPEPEIFAEPDAEVLELTEPIYEPVEPGPIDPIMSDQPAETASASFDHLSDLMVAGYPGADNTLEELVRAMLKPMLQGWLDQNLPSIVQDAVEREVARIARRK